MFLFSLGIEVSFAPTCLLFSWYQRNDDSECLYVLLVFRPLLRPAEEIWNFEISHLYPTRHLL